MVGLWTRDVASVCRRRPLDALRPAAAADALVHVAVAHRAARRRRRGGARRGGGAADAHAVPRVAAPWERIDGGGGGAAGDDTWAGRTLEPPEGRNHRFWVKSMGEFREQMECGGADDSE